MGLSAELVAVGPFATEISPYLAYPRPLYRETKPGNPVISFIYQAGFTSAVRELEKALTLTAARLDCDKVDLYALQDLPKRTSLGGRSQPYEAFVALRDFGFAFYLACDAVSTVWPSQIFDNTLIDQNALLAGGAARLIAIPSDPAGGVDSFEFSWNSVFLAQRLAEVLGLKVWDFNTHLVTKRAEDLVVLPLYTVFEFDDPYNIAAYDVRRDADLFVAWISNHQKAGNTIFYLPA